MAFAKITHFKGVKMHHEVMYGNYVILISDVTDSNELRLGVGHTHDLSVIPIKQSMCLKKMKYPVFHMVKVPATCFSYDGQYFSIELNWQNQHTAKYHQLVISIVDIRLFISCSMTYEYTYVGFS